VRDGEVNRELVNELAANHDEADTRIALHVKSIDTDGANHIVIQASDTDVAIILLFHSAKFGARIWMDAGTGNKRRYVAINAITASLGRDMCAALPGLHAFTGSDFTSAFVRKGKARPLAILEKNQEYQGAFRQLAECPCVSTSTCKTLQDFTCELYGARKRVALNDFRNQKFEKAFRPKANSANLLHKLAGKDGSSLPPCESEIKIQTHRVAFVARMWGGATNAQIQIYPTAEDGWAVADDGQSYDVVWFEGPQMPDALVADVDVESDDETDDLVQSSDDEMMFDDEHDMTY